MVVLGGWFILLSAVALVRAWRGHLLGDRRLLWAIVLTVPGPHLANQAGWVAAEVGRQPWVVYGLLRTKDAASKARAHRWMWVGFGFFLAFYVATSIGTLIAVPHATANFARWPAAWIVVALNVLAIANVPRAIHKGMPRYAFVSSSATIIALTFLLGMAIFPNLAVSSVDPAFSLTVWSAASSETTLRIMRIMRIIAFLGMPFVLTYTGIVY